MRKSVIIETRLDQTLDDSHHAHQKEVNAKEKELQESGHAILGSGTTVAKIADSRRNLVYLTTLLVEEPPPAKAREPKAFEE